MSEVERVCDRIGLVRKGELVLLSAVEELRKLAARSVRVIFAEDVPGPRSWNLQVVGPLGPLIKSIAELPVRDIEIEESKLEDVILKYYRDGKQ
jgi:ABC-2 type transport system ATP-binding protein